MKFDPDRHPRHSIRLQGYDYSQAGAYFVTIVIHNRACILGDIVDGEMRLSAAGEMIEKWWFELEGKFPTVTLEAHMVMPNHFHGIIYLVGVDLRVDPGSGGHTGPPLPRDPGPGGHAGPPLLTIIQWFKTMTTNDYIRAVKQLGWPTFDGKLWQRYYHDHIIRNEDEHQRIHNYVEANPLNWISDDENPEKPR